MFDCDIFTDFVYPVEVVQETVAFIPDVPLVLNIAYHLVFRRRVHFVYYTAFKYSFYGTIVKKMVIKMGKS